MKIHWQIKRLDEGEEPDSRFAECLLEISGRVDCDGQTAGVVDAFYLFSEDPSSARAFLELWDTDGASCAVFEAIIDHECGLFHEPLPDFLDPASGILVFHYIALRPEFRHMGLGQAVMRESVRALADPRIGLVLLDARPLQHRPNSYDHFDDEVRDLPWNSPEIDETTLTLHLNRWGMQRLPETRFMMAAPEMLRDARTPQWPPCPVVDQWNACAICGEWIDMDGHEWDDTADGPVHLKCDGGQREDGDYKGGMHGDDDLPF